MRLERELREALAPGIAPRPEHRRALEAELFGTDAAAGARVSAVFGVRRLAMALVVALVAVACAVPATFRVGAGRRVTLETTITDGLEATLQAVAEDLGAREVMVNVRKTGASDAPARVVVELWGGQVAQSPVADRMRARWPSSPAPAMTETVLEGRVRRTLAGRLRDVLWDAELGEDELAEIRRIIASERGLDLQQMDVDVDVAVEVEGGQTRRRVRVRAHAP